MLKGIDRSLSAEMLLVLMSMGHGDDILVCDVNHPAATIARHTTHGRLIDMAGCDISRAIDAILSLMPLDTFVDHPVKRMAVVGDAQRVLSIHTQVQALLDANEGRPVGMQALERFAAGNDLEPAAIGLCPLIGDTLATMRLLPGCLLARMSGSGATVFGLFETCRSSATAAKLLRVARPEWWIRTTMIG